MKKGIKKTGRKKSLVTAQRRVLAVLQKFNDDQKIRILRATALLLGMGEK